MAELSCIIQIIIFSLVLTELKTMNSLCKRNDKPLSACCGECSSKNKTRHPVTEIMHVLAGNLQMSVVLKKYVSIT